MFCLLVIIILVGGSIGLTFLLCAIYDGSESSGKHKVVCPCCKNDCMIVDGEYCKCYNPQCLIGRQGRIRTDEIYKYY